MKFWLVRFCRDSLLRLFDISPRNGTWYHYHPLLQHCVWSAQRFANVYKTHFRKSTLTVGLLALSFLVVHNIWVGRRCEDQMKVLLETVEDIVGFILQWRRISDSHFTSSNGSFMKFLGYISKVNKNLVCIDYTTACSSNQRQSKTWIGNASQISNVADATSVLPPAKLYL